MEYPFKDLLPLDEVLEREGYYKDWTHLDPEVFYSLTQISEYIKTKGYGVDVRLLIAQLAEHFGLKSTQIIDLANLLQQKFANLEGITQSFTNNINSLVAQMQADKDAVIANATVDSEVILARGGKPTLQARLDEIEVIKSVRSFGAKGNGVDSDVDAIILGSQSGTTLGFPNGTYVIDRHILIENKKKLKWVALGDDVVFLDKGQPVRLVDGTDSNAPFGIKFLNCDIEFEGFNHKNDIEVTGQISEIDEHAIIPQIDFIGGNVTFVRNLISGIVQPHMYTNHLTTNEINSAEEAMRASYVRFVNCETVVFSNNELTSGAGSGEIFGFLNIRNLKISDSNHSQSEANRTFWSFAKIIACGRVSLNDVSIQSKSTGSFIDVSGDHIDISNIDADYPNGKLVDMTQEWGYANQETKSISLKNSKTNSDVLAFVSEGSGLNLMPIDKVVIDNIDWRPEIDNPTRTGVGHRWVRDLTVKNMPFSNLRYLNYIAPPTTLENIALFDNVKLTSDKQVTDTTTVIETAGTTIIKDSYVNQEYINRLELRDRTKYPSGDLRTSSAKIIFKNCLIEKTIIQIRSNVEFIDCDFIDVGFATATTITNYPSITFTRPSFKYTVSTADFSSSGFKPFDFNYVHNFKIIGCREMSGIYINPNGYHVINMNNWTVSGIVEIDGLYADVRRYGTDGKPHSGLQPLMGITGNNVSNNLSLSLNQVTINEYMLTALNYTGTLSSSYELMLKVSNSVANHKASGQSGQLVRFDTDDVSAVKLMLVNNVFVAGKYKTLSQIREMDFKNIADAGNTEW